MTPPPTVPQPNNPIRIRRSLCAMTYSVVSAAGRRRKPRWAASLGLTAAAHSFLEALEDWNIGAQEQRDQVDQHLALQRDVVRRAERESERPCHRERPWRRET